MWSGTDHGNLLAIEATCCNQFVLVGDDLAEVGWSNKTGHANCDSSNRHRSIQQNEIFLREIEMKMRNLLLAVSLSGLHDRDPEF